MEKREIKIKAKDEDLKGVYANLMIVSHTREEFCLDFINAFNPPILVSRVLTSPAHLKRMINALSENMRIYEEKFGKVEPAKEVEIPIGFRPQ
jgi:hypothetical protein